METAKSLCLYIKILYSIHQLTLESQMNFLIYVPDVLKTFFPIYSKYEY